MNIIPVISIVLEILIALLALMSVFQGKPYMVGLVITFGIYVYYDLARHYNLEVSESLLSIVFLIATLSALVAVIGIIKSSSKK